MNTNKAVKILNGAEKLTIYPENDQAIYENLTGEEYTRRETSAEWEGEDYDNFAELILEELESTNRNTDLFPDIDSRREDRFEVYEQDEHDGWSMAYNETKGYDQASLITKIVFRELAYKAQNKGIDELVEAD